MIDMWNGVDFEKEGFDRGRTDYVQDGCENAPFASVGGLEARANLIAPPYITVVDKDISGQPFTKAYLEGYAFQAEIQYGADWRTCEFSWKPAVTLNLKDKG